MILYIFRTKKFFEQMLTMEGKRHIDLNSHHNMFGLAPFLRVHPSVSYMLYK